MENTQDSEKTIEFVIPEDSTFTTALLTFIKAWSHYKLADEGLTKHIHNMLEQSSPVSYLKDNLKLIIEANEIKPYELHHYILNRPSYSPSRVNDCDSRLADGLTEFYSSHELFATLMGNTKASSISYVKTLLNTDSLKAELETISNNVKSEFVKLLFKTYTNNLDELKRNIQEYKNITNNDTLYLDSDMPDECIIDLDYDIYQLCHDQNIDIKSEAIKILNEDDHVVTNSGSYDNFHDRFLANSVTWFMSAARYNCCLYHTNGDLLMPNDDIIKSLIPQEGKCSTKLGEMIRACQRIIYRFINDGDTATSIMETNTPYYANLIKMTEDWIRDDEFNVMKLAVNKLSKDEYYKKYVHYGLFNDPYFPNSYNSCEARMNLLRFMFDCGCEGSAVQVAMEFEILLIQCYLINKDFLNESNYFDSICSND